MNMHYPSIAVYSSSARQWMTHSIDEDSEHQARLRSLLQEGTKGFFPKWSPWQFAVDPGADWAHYHTFRARDVGTIGVIAWNEPGSAHASEILYNLVSKTICQISNMGLPVAPEFLGALEETLKVIPLPWLGSILTPSGIVALLEDSYEQMIWHENELAGALISSKQKTVPSSE